MTKNKITILICLSIFAITGLFIFARPSFATYSNTDIHPRIVLPSLSVADEYWFGTLGKSVNIPTIYCGVDPQDSGDVVTLSIFTAPTWGGATTTILSENIGCGNAESSSSTIISNLTKGQYWGVYVEAVTGTADNTTVWFDGSSNQ